MTPVKFPEANSVLKGGPGENWGTDSEVLELCTHRSNGMVISCWSMTWRDRLRLLLTGKVWLTVLGTNQSPVYLGSEYPFRKGGQ